MAQERSRLLSDRGLLGMPYPPPEQGPAGKLTDYRGHDRERERIG
jgi:hypothetical protein